MVIQEKNGDGVSWILVFANFLGTKIPAVASINSHDITEQGFGMTRTATQHFHRVDTTDLKKHPQEHR